MLERFFHLREHGTTVGREVLAGLTTFAAMSYILAVHPAILKDAGMDPEASVAVTAIVACGATLAMGLYARRPFAIAPYMGENAFIAYTVVAALGHTWQEALGAVFLGGVLFTAVTLLGLRAWLARAVPAALRHAFVVGIGLFLTFVGLNVSGLIEKPPGAVPVDLAPLDRIETALALGGLLLMFVLHVFRVRAAILLGIVAVTVAGALSGAWEPPEAVFKPPRIDPVFLKLDIGGALTLDFFPVILTVFILDFLDTMGTLLGVSARAGLLDEHGDLPEIEKPMLVDSLATVGGALLGTTTSGVFIESAAGIEAGGRTGLTAVVTALCFLPALFLGGLLGSIPGYAYGPALMLVGLLMFESVRRIELSDETEAIPAFATVAFMVFTFNLGHGITIGLILYPFLKLVRGRAREVPLGLWILAALSFAYYALKLTIDILAGEG